MRILRYVLYGFVALLVLGWSGAWLAGQRILLRELRQHGLDVQVDELHFRADDVRVGGFPFHYRVSPRGAQISGLQDMPTLTLDDRIAVQVSVVGSALSLLSGGELSVQVQFPGTYEVDDLASIRVDSGWIRTGLSGFSLGNQDTWVFDGVDMDIDALAVSMASGDDWVIFETLTLDMNPLGNAPGYSYALDLTGLTPGFLDLGRVPPQIDQIALRGRIQPDLRSDYFRFLDAATENPMEALISNAEVIRTLLSSAPGIYVTEGTLKWGEASIKAQLDFPLTLAALQQQLHVKVAGTLAFTGVGTFLEELLRAPSVQQVRGLAPLISGIRATAPRLGLDLNQGRTSTLDGTLITIGTAGVRPTPERVLIDGRPLSF